ncbi:MAG: hypothetical protein HYV75_07480 [Opitutae bacterium]|nr:hypothetical protein [Opitutae bacterium]
MAILLCAILVGSGCATSGPNHIYLTTAASAAVRDIGPTPAAVEGAVAPGERVTGLAYDFNTDHLFLRITPAQVIRVIERPSGKILREMPLPWSVPMDTAPADIRPDEGRWTDPVRPAGLNRAPRAPSREQPGAALAIRSSDRHLFAAYPDGRSIVELTLFGGFVRRLELRGADDPVAGLAYDQKNERLLVLTATSPARIGYVAPDGSVTYYVTLPAPVRPVSLGFDSDAQHAFVPLADGTSLGEFDAAGALVRTHPTGDTGAITAIDAGPRSFVRVF